MIAFELIEKLKTLVDALPGDGALPRSGWYIYE